MSKQIISVNLPQDLVLWVNTLSEKLEIPRSLLLTYLLYYCKEKTHISDILIVLPILSEDKKQLEREVSIKIQNAD